MPMLSMNVLEWIVWALLGIYTVAIFVNWFNRKKHYKHGHSYFKSEVISLYSIPRIFMVETVVLLGFLLTDINKLHLLWLYPAIYFAIRIWMTRKVEKAAEERPRKAR